MNRWIVPVLALVLASGAAQAGVAPVQGKDKDKGKPQAEQPVQLPSYPHYDDKDEGKHKDNHGQVVSECNHRANERNMKGQERKDFVEWCESRGARYKYDYRRYDGDRSCYQKANSIGLTGDRRANFLEKCFADRGDDDHGGKEPKQKKN